MKAEKYPTNRTIDVILKASSGILTYDKSWVCNTCHLSMNHGKVPIQSWINGLGLDVISPALSDPRPLELRLISQRIPFMKVVVLPKGGQKAIHGSAVNVPSKLQPVVSSLPRLPDTAQAVALKLKRNLCYKGHHMHEYIQPRMLESRTSMGPDIRQKLIDYLETTPDKQYYFGQYYSVNTDELDRACEDLKRMEPPEDVWDAVASKCGVPTCGRRRRRCCTGKVASTGRSIKKCRSSSRGVRLQQQMLFETSPSAAPTVTRRRLQIRLLNIRSYFEHGQDLKADNTLQNVDVLFRGNVLEAESTNRPATMGHGGGVMTVAKQEIAPTDIHLNASGLEYTAVGVTISSTKINIITIYRSPSLKNHLTIVLGDFKVDFLDDPNHEFLTTINQFGFDQLVQKPTTNCGSLLDHVHVNQDRRPQVTVTDCYFSDHDVVCVSLKF
uniref:DUF6570 domain-containing protein n=1 Tax=Octopus bimaculoides TaxID=37653 RepID=A0A0L8IC15_OCTBM